MPFSGGTLSDGGVLPSIQCKATNPVYPLNADGTAGETCSRAFYTADTFGDGQHIGCCVQAKNTATDPPTVRFFECCKSSGFGDGTPYDCP
jgi:hypothetical protein